MADSFWKKEVSFGKKKPKGDDPAAVPADVVPDAPAAPEAPAAPAADTSSSMWKKEISFGRKQKVEWDAAEPKQKVSVWKKDISFGKKKAPTEVDRMAEEAAQAVSPTFAPPSVAAVPPVPDVPPTAVAEAAVAAMAEQPVVSAPAPEPVEPALVEPALVEPAPVDSGPVAPVPELALGLAAADALSPPAEPEPAEPLHLASVEPEAAAPVPELLPELTTEPEPEPAPAPEPAAPFSPLSPAILAATVAETAADETPVAAEPPVPAAPVEPDPWLASPELPPAPEIPVVAAFAAELPEPPQQQEPAPQELQPEPAHALPLTQQQRVFPPVPAAELPPVVEKKVPVWKKEISFGRKGKAEFDAMDAAFVAAAAANKKQPWYKKELGGKKKKDNDFVEAAAPVAAGADVAVAAPAKKQPWYKKELGGKKKAEAASVALGTAAAVAMVDGDAPAPTKKQPWYKKELGGKKTKAVETAAVAVALEDVASAPFWKRGMSIGMPSLSRNKGGSGKSLKGQNLVGLKIGGSQIAAARVSNNGVAALEQVARQPLPMGIVVGGELRDPDALTEALKAFFAKNKLPKKGVRLGIANPNRIGVRTYPIDGTENDKQLANAMQYRASDLLNIPLDEAVLDWQVVDESVDAEGTNSKRVLLVVAYRDLVDRYVDACRKAGITLAGIDLEAFAMLRALSAPAEPSAGPADPRGLVAVAIGFDRSTFAVTDGRVCDFTRVLEWGGSALNSKLADAFNSAPSEVETLKCSLSLDGTIVPEGLAPESVAVAVDVVKRELGSFARQLVESLQFYQNQPGSLPIAEIVVTGGTAQMPGLADELSRLIGVPVRVGNPLARLKVSKRVSASDQQVGSLAVAIGLGIED
jgi:type IV pilus assembly protein PilM